MMVVVAFGSSQGSFKILDFGLAMKMYQKRRRKV